MTGAEITQIVSVVVAAATVVFGVTAWRREFVGRRNIELAEEVLVLFYQARDAIHYIRSPMALAGEGKTRQADPTETDQEKQILDVAWATRERYNNTRQEVFARLHSVRYRFMARFGPESVKPFDDLLGVVGDILISADMYALCRKDLLHAQDDERRKQLVTDMREHEAVIWWRGKDDTINPKVDAAIQAMEAICRPIIQKPRLGSRCLSTWRRLARHRIH